jgi:hypothetical protein
MAIPFLGTGILESLLYFGDQARRQKDHTLLVAHTKINKLLGLFFLAKEREIDMCPSIMLIIIA